MRVFYSFERQSDEILNQLNADTDLFNIWRSDEIVNLKIHKKDVEFLKGYKFLNNNNEIVSHALLGDISIVRPKQANGSLGNTKVTLSGMHNPRLITIPPPYQSGKWNFKNNDFIENHQGYRKGKVERTMTPQDIDPMNGQRWKNNFETGDRIYVKTKNDVTGFWPSSFSDQRIKEEMALVFSNKTPSPTTRSDVLKFDGQASDGMLITVYRDQYGKWSIFPNNRYINEITN